MTLQSLLTALITAGGLFSAPAASADDVDRYNVCAEACVEYLDSGAALRCMVQCDVDTTAPTLRAPVTDIPDWMPTSDTALEQTDDHAWCLNTCDDASRSETDRETCRLNCAASWSVLTSTPTPCDDARAERYGELCPDAATSACERGCFASAVTCRDACADDEDARATDAESCMLRCDNVRDLCSKACTTDDPDAFVSVDVEPVDASDVPGC